MRPEDQGNESIAPASDPAVRLSNPIPNTKRKTPSKPAAASKPEGRTKRARRVGKPSVRAISKQDRVLAMLQRKEGTSIAAITKATGWQMHSVRGFFAGVVRKKLRLNLKSDLVNGKRIYRIVSGKASKSASKSKRGR